MDLKNYMGLFFNKRWMGHGFWHITIANKIQATNVKGESKTSFINPLSSILVPNYRRLIIATQCRLVKIILK